MYQKFSSTQHQLKLINLGNVSLRRWRSKLQGISGLQGEGFRVTGIKIWTRPEFFFNGEDLSTTGASALEGFK